MRLVVTGGGTGGHVYPALEVAEVARVAGAEVQYIGSLRGLESEECAKRDVAFSGLRSVPLARLWTPRGLLSAIVTVRALGVARRVLSDLRPDIVFSTGGYAAGPVLSAAKTLGIRCVIHEQNTIPGRTHRIAGRFAKRACVVFDESGRWLTCPVVRTGMPVRQEIVDAARVPREKHGISTFVFGGSQGAAAINEAVLTLVMQHGSGGEWLHVTGPKLYEDAAKAAERLATPTTYRIRPYLESSEMADAMASASIAICRSGSGTISELALFGVPSVMIPYPYAQADHQYHNAKAIEHIGGAIVMRQSEMTPKSLADSWLAWAEDADRRQTAASNLRAWAVPDAARRVWETISEVAREA